MRIHELLFSQLADKRWGGIDLESWVASDIKKSEKNPLLDPDYFQGWLGNIHKAMECDYSHGGYLQYRCNPWRGSYILSDEA